jgi:hypothetical protein
MKTPTKAKGAGKKNPAKQTKKASAKSPRKAAAKDLKSIKVDNLVIAHVPSVMPG